MEPITWICILSISIIVLLYVVINLFNKITILQRLLGERDAEIESTESRAINVYNFVLKSLAEAHIELTRVDKRGAFSTDDEVGVVFGIIKETLEHVKYQLESLTDESPTDPI